MTVCNGWELDIAGDGHLQHILTMKIGKASLPTLAILFVPAMASADPLTCSAPPANWGKAKDGISHLRGVLPVIVRRDGTILWNGSPVSDSEFKRYMTAVGSLNPQPQVILDVTNTPNCKRLQQVRIIMTQASICRRLCSEGANWRRWRITGGP